MPHIGDPDDALQAAEVDLDRRRGTVSPSGRGVASRVVVGLVVLAIAAWLVMAWLNAHHPTPPM
jgi:hypothetical protein